MEKMKSVFNDHESFLQFKKNIADMSHAYLFVSPDKLTNELFVKEIAQLILCENKNNCNSCGSCAKALANSHPDILVYPKGKIFMVEDANEINDKALESPMIGDKKVIIINSIDEATIQSQNKILKTVEEPPKSVIFLLTAQNENKILPTIISRTRKSRLSPFAINKIEELVFDKDFTAQFAIENHASSDIIEHGEGWIGKTILGMSNINFQKEKKIAEEVANEFDSSKALPKMSAQILEFRDNLADFFSILEHEFEKQLKGQSHISQEGLIKIIEEINIANQDLETYVNPAIVTDNLLMKILEAKYFYQI